MRERPCVIYWTREGKRAWRFRSVVKLPSSLPGLFGLFVDWVFFRFSCTSYSHSLYNLSYSSFSYSVFMLTNGSFIIRNGLKLYRAFSMPSVVILLVLISGRLFFLSWNFLLFSYLILMSLNSLVPIFGVFLGFGSCLPAIGNVYCCN